MSPGKALSRGLLLLPVCAYLAWGLLYIQRTSFDVDGERVYSLWDDAMISMRYARNLAEGRGLTWNGDDERVLGITNPGVTLVMAALHLLPLPIRLLPLLVQLADLAILCAILAVCGRLAGRLFGRDTPVPLAAVLLVAACAPLAIWGLQGSDVAPQTLLLLLGLDAIAARDLEGLPWPPAALYLLAAAIWIRPDASVALLAVAGFGCALGPGRRRIALHAALALALTWLPLLGLAWLYYGDPLPNTFYLKATGSPRRLVLESGVYQALWLLRGALPALVLCAVGGPICYGRRRWLWLFASVAAAQLAYHVWVGGDWQSEYASRYLVPVLPLGALLLAGVAWAIAAWLRPRTAPAAAYAAFALLVGAGGFALSTPVSRAEWFDREAPTMLWKYNRLLYYYGAYFRDHTAPDTTIAHHWAGIAPYVAERPAIDMLGRSDRHVARLAVPRFAPGHSKWDWDYLLEERRPDIILGADRGLETHPVFLGLYTAARTTSNLVFYIRAGSRSKIDDPDLGYPWVRGGTR